MVPKFVSMVALCGRLKRRPGSTASPVLITSNGLSMMGANGLGNEVSLPAAYTISDADGFGASVLSCVAG
jgi:hypothetical protein